MHELELKTLVPNPVRILQVVFRPQQSKHKSFVAACFEFENRLSDCKDLLANLNCEGAGQLEVDRVCNWQVRYVCTDYDDLKTICLRSFSLLLHSSCGYVD